MPFVQHTTWTAVPCPSLASSQTYLLQTAVQHITRTAVPCPSLSSRQVIAGVAGGTGGTGVAGVAGAGADAARLVTDTGVVVVVVVVVRELDRSRWTQTNKLPWPNHVPSVFGRNLQCEPVR